MEFQDQTVLAIKLIFALLGVAAVVAFVLLPIWRMLHRMDEAEMLMKPFEPPEEEELQIPVDGLNTGRKRDRNELLEDVRADPRRAALVMQQWLREKKSGARPAPPPKGS